MIQRRGPGRSRLPRRPLRGPHDAAEGRQRHPLPDAARHHRRPARPVFRRRRRHQPRPTPSPPPRSPRPTTALQGAVRDINLDGARIAREAADRWTAKTPDKPRFVAGSIGPLNVMLSMSSDVNDPGARKVTFDQVYAAYREQAQALHEGGVDLFLIETITDTLNCKAAIKAILDLAGRGLRAAADLDFRHHHRPLRPHALRPDGRGVLELGAPRPALRRRAQLRAGRRADAPAHRRAGADRRHPGRRLSRTPACRTPWANTTRARTRPPASSRSGPGAASSTSSAAAAAPPPTTSATSPRMWRTCRPGRSPNARRPCGCLGWKPFELA